jgi:hypothetical protein|tara:strand:+ start:781 stop:978 length:198 start_codon:yes stop_codon:yes gene_type:complete
MKANIKLTSVKLLKDLYERFKSITINTKMTLQKLSNRSMSLYISDEQFRDRINNTDELLVSGSNF